MLEMLLDSARQCRMSHSNDPAEPVLKRRGGWVAVESIPKHRVQKRKALLRLAKRERAFYRRQQMSATGVARSGHLCIEVRLVETDRKTREIFGAILQGQTGTAVEVQYYREIQSRSDVADVVRGAYVNSV